MVQLHSPFPQSFITETDLLRKLKFKQNWIAEWSIIKRSIPIKLVDILKKGNVETPKTNKQTLNIDGLNLLNYDNKIIPPCKLKTKLIQTFIHLKSTTPPKAQSNWEEKLNLDNIDWNIVWGNIKMSYCSNKSKQFQWKFLHNTIFTEHRLNLMRMSNGLCNMCKSERETLFHLFFNCVTIQPVLAKFEIIINAVIDRLDIGLRNLQFADIVLGYHKVPNKCNLLNTILFELKWNTWKFRNSCKFDKKTYTAKILFINTIRCLKDQIIHLNPRKENTQAINYILGINTNDFCL